MFVGNMLFCTYNIHYGVGADGCYDVARIADAVADADIVCIQEAAAGWHVNGHADQTAEIAQRLNRYHWYHGAMEADASVVGADGRIVNRRRSFGNAIVSRWPITWARGHLLPKTRLVTGFDLQRGIVEAVVEAPSGPLRVHSVHLSHVGAQQRLPQVRALMDTVLNADRVGGMDGRGNYLSTHQIICLLLHHFIVNRKGGGHVVKALTTTATRRFVRTVK